MAAEEIDLMDPETLEILIQSSKVLESHPQISPHLQTLLHLLSPSNPNPNLVLHLRLLRNLLAGDASLQSSFIESKGPDSIASIILSKAPIEIIKVGLQVLGNVALGGEAYRAAVWARMFPEGFLDLARVRARVCDQLSMVLDTCCSGKGERRRLWDLCGDERGLEIVVEMVRTACSEDAACASLRAPPSSQTASDAMRVTGIDDASAEIRRSGLPPPHESADKPMETGTSRTWPHVVREGYQEEWLEWLLTKICIEESYLPELFAKLGSLGDSDGSDVSQSQNIVFTVQQAFLFRTLSYCLSERPREVTVSTEFALGVLKILKEATCSVDFSYRGSSELPTGSPAIDVLGYSIVMSRDICAWEVPPSLGSKPPMESLLSAGIVELFLSLLRELDPPLIVKRSIAQAIREGEQLVMAGKVCPYKGYRRDLVSVLANCLHERKHVQDEVRERNGIMLLLQQAVIDEDNPFFEGMGAASIK